MSTSHQSLLYLLIALAERRCALALAACFSRRDLLGAVLIGGELLALRPAWTQEPQDQQQQEEGKYEFVSGVVTSVGDDRIVVNRAVPGRRAENHTFLIVSETRVEGDLQVGARVTVGYRRTEQGDVAVRVIVRPPAPQSRREP